jgi:hypothetical protein
VIIIITVYRCGPSAVGSAPGQCMYVCVPLPPPFIGKKISLRVAAPSRTEPFPRPTTGGRKLEKYAVRAAPMTENDLEVRVTKS